MGKGAFGNVYLVELDPALNQIKNEKDPNKGKIFAMKVINKSIILEQSLTRYAKTERDILAKYNQSDFIVKLYFAF